MKCPKCGSEHTQAIKMAIAAGTTSGSVVGAGIGLSGSLGAGMGITGSSTALAQSLMAGPKSKVNYLLVGRWYIYVGIFSVVLGIMSFFSDGAINVFSFMLGIPFLLVGWYYSMKRPPDTSAWEAKYRLQENGWICYRCGETWLP